MRLWPRSHFSLWIAGIFYGLGVLVILSTAAINRLGPESGRLGLDECRLVTDRHSGLFAMLKDGSDGIRLAATADLSPSSYARSLAERLGSGPLVQTENNQSLSSLSVYIVLNAKRKYDAGKPSAQSKRPLLIVDSARSMDHLVQRYSPDLGMAVARGYYQLANTGQRSDQKLRLAVEYPTLPRAARHMLKRLPPQDDADNACRSRFLLDIRYGALGHPWVAGLRPLSGPTP